MVKKISVEKKNDLIRMLKTIEEIDDELKIVLTEVKTSFKSYGFDFPAEYGIIHDLIGLYEAKDDVSIDEFVGEGAANNNSLFNILKDIEPDVNDLHAQINTVYGLLLVELKDTSFIEVYDLNNPPFKQEIDLENNNLLVYDYPSKPEKMHIVLPLLLETTLEGVDFVKKTISDIKGIINLY